MSKIIQALESFSVQSPNKTAVTGTRVSLSWHELNVAVQTVSLELGQTKTLGLMVSNSPAWVIADLSAIKAGVQHVPLPAFFSNEQILHAIQNAQIDTIITDDTERFAKLALPSSSIDIVIAGRHLKKITLQQSRTSETCTTSAKVIYTSGTTGSPRGVQLSLRAIETVAISLASAVNANSNDRALVTLPLPILLENIGSVYAPILAGAEILAPDAVELGIEGSSHVDAAALSLALCKYRPTTMILPPQLLKLVVDLARRKKLPDSFRYIAVGGAPVGKSLLNAAGALKLPVYQGYGLSEACSVVAMNTASNNRPGSVGKPLPGNTVRISVNGEIIVQGEAFSGYLGDTQRDPECELATGDMGYLDKDGYLFVTGRVRDCIITGYGRNISPEWVESELQSHPAIAQASVLGNDLSYLIAIIVPDGSVAAASTLIMLDEAIRDVNAGLPDYAAIREYVVASSPFSLDTGELTANRCLRRDVIAQHYAQQIRQLPENNHEKIL